MIPPALDPLAIVVAMDEGRCIGHDGGMPWHHPEDLRYFRRLTTGHAVIMGRRTYESIGRPLPNRRNLVVSRDPAFAAAGCEVLASLDAAIARARCDDPMPMIIGGAQLYAAALPQVSHLFITRVAGRHAGDTFFPELPPGFEPVSATQAATPGLVFEQWARRVT